jgi:hypothetical protein
MSGRAIRRKRGRTRNQWRQIQRYHFYVRHLCLVFKKLVSITGWAFIELRECTRNGNMYFEKYIIILF